MPNSFDRSPFGRPPTTDPDVVLEVLRLYQNGARPVDLAREYGIKPWTLQHWLYKHGVLSHREERAEAWQAQLEEAVQMYIDGATHARIYRQTGVMFTTLRYQLIKRN